MSDRLLGKQAFYWKKSIMKTRIETLRDFASDTASAASRGLSSVQDAAGKAGSVALAAGKSAQRAIDNVLEHEDTKAVAAKVKELAGKVETVSASLGIASGAVAVGAKKLTGCVADALKEADANHKEIAGKVETVSMGLGIASGAAAAGAALAAPTGLSAVGVALGITSAPLIVTAAPVIGAVATTAGVVSGGAYFYSKWKTRKAKEEHGEKSSSEMDESSEVDINSADYDQLLSLPGIKTAEAKLILAERAGGRRFTSLDELSEFLDLKPHKAEQLKDHAAFSGGAPAQTPRASGPDDAPQTRSRSGRVVD
jgi:DNA uptake protein ComE-like DNA-binding protein